VDNKYCLLIQNYFSIPMSIKETYISDTQLKGIKQIIALKEDFAQDKISWLESLHITVKNHEVHYSNMIDTLVNTFCSYELADNNYITIHLEASQYSNNKLLFANTTIDKLLKHLTYIIWTDKVVDGYLPARVKDQTVYNILNRLSELESSILSPAA